VLWWERGKRVLSMQLCRFALKKRELLSYYHQQLIEKDVIYGKPLNQKSLLRYFAMHFLFFKKMIGIRPFLDA
jgi:hypothetical protein